MKLTNIYHQFSIKKLLKIWVLITIAVVIIISGLSIYSNRFLSQTQSQLTRTMLNVEQAGRQISGIIASFILRQESFLISESEESMLAIQSTRMLEQQFNQNWEQIISSITLSAQALDVTDQLLEDYRQFLEIDQQLYQLILNYHRTNRLLTAQLEKLQDDKNQINKLVESISGKINLQIARAKRALKKASQAGNDTGSSLLAFARHQDHIRHLNHEVKINTLRVINLIPQIIQARTTDELASIEGNKISQYQEQLLQSIEQLAQTLGSDKTLKAPIIQLKITIQQLLNKLYISQNSIINLRRDYLTNKSHLAEKQKLTTAILTRMVAGLNQLSFLIKSENIRQLYQSEKFANTLVLFIILLALMIIVAMFVFIATLSKGINHSLSEFHQAMHSLSRGKFEKRLPVYSKKNEFSRLARDFNQFASNNQQLIEELAAAKDEVSLREQFIRAIFNGVPEAILTLSEQGVIHSANDAAELVLGAPHEQLLGTSVFRFFDREQKIENMEHLLFQVKNKHEIIGLDYQQNPFYMMISLNEVIHQNKKYWICVIADITEQKKKDDKLMKLATIDTLTGLPNRQMFHDRLEYTILQNDRKNSILAVFFLDLDRFKQVNDTLGHKAGDILLCEVAKRLTSCVRKTDTVARLGGDEFTIILDNITSVQYIVEIAKKILSQVSRPVIIEGTEVDVSTSIGISIYPADAKSSDEIVVNADVAMYHAKKSGRNNFQFYASQMNDKAAERLSLQADLRRAIDEKQFFLNFQPQIDIQSGKISGAEVLLRWIHPHKGFISPAEFIPVLEDSGLIKAVGVQVLEQAAVAFNQIQPFVDADFKLAINLSAHQFNDKEIINQVLKLLENSNMNHSNLELEITESVLMDDTNLAISILNEFKQSGITIAIDDFGTGYSSLSYLKQFPLNILKIDRSFINDVEKDSDDTAIVAAILAMSHSLGLEVVAEGVENKTQLRFLKQHQCRYIQGFYFSKPLTVDDFIDYVKNFHLADDS